MLRQVLSVIALNHPQESAHLIPHPTRIYAKSTLKYNLCHNRGIIHKIDYIIIF